MRRKPLLVPPTTLGPPTLLLPTLSPPPLSPPPLSPPGRSRFRHALLIGICLGCVVPASPRAQLGALVGGRNAGAPVSKNDPVAFTADTVEYDRDGALVTASGRVEAWQGNRVMRADKITFDRDTNVAAASGHVVMLEEDGQVLFSDYAEMTQGMKNGVLRDIRASLAENGKLAANGGRRLDGGVNELSRAIYSTCNVCAQHPERPVLWDIRAAKATQDVINKRIEYEDAVVDIHGIPVAYFPYLTQPDPSVRRASGFLIPSFGQGKYLGTFLSVPYFLALDDQSDATMSPLLSTNSAPALDLQYRRRFNSGTVTANGSIGYTDARLQGHLFTKGQFVLDDTFRYGFDINRASSTNYLRNYRVSALTDVLTSQIYLEGFGQGAYTRLDARAYQGLTTSIVAAKLPYVLPRYEYSFVGEPDALGGRLGVEAGAFNVVRDLGTSTQRASLSVNWERPFAGALGDLYKFVLHADSATYLTRGIEQQPNYSTAESSSGTQAMGDVALQMHWPFMRDAGTWGTQIIEPIGQIIASPNGSSYNLGTRIPNEDSLDYEFTDANLFSLNRFPGIDRLEGGPRAQAALHANWTFPEGAMIDGLVGQSYRTHRNAAFPTGSGLENKVSDVVSRVSFTPTPLFDLTTRERFDHKNGNLRFADALVSAGPPILRVNAGYIYTAYDPYSLYDSPATAQAHSLTGPPRNEVTVGASTRFGPWRLNGYARRDIETAKMVGVGLGGTYEDECFVFDAKYFRRYTSVNNDHGATTILFTITLKTVGQFGFHAF